MTQVERDLQAEQAWGEVAAQGNQDLDAYLRTQMPSLPRHYGMPADGVRMVVGHVRKRTAEVMGLIGMVVAFVTSVVIGLCV